MIVLINELTPLSPTFLSIHMGILGGVTEIMMRENGYSLGKYFNIEMLQKVVFTVQSTQIEVSTFLLAGTFSLLGAFMAYAGNRLLNHREPSN